MDTCLESASLLSTMASIGGEGLEIRLLQSNGYALENRAIVLNEQLADVAIADEAGVKAAHRLAEERLNVPSDQ